MQTRHYDLVTTNGTATQIIQLRQKGNSADDYFSFFQPKSLIVNTGTEAIYFYMLSKGETKSNSTGVLLQANTEYAFDLDKTVYQVDITAVDFGETGYSESTIEVSPYNYVLTGEDYFNGVLPQGNV